MPTKLKGPLRGTYKDDDDDLIVGVKLGELREMNDFIVDAMIYAALDDNEKLHSRALKILSKEN